MSKQYWTCLNCNEQVESQFEVCWNCQHDRTGVVPPSYSSLEMVDHAPARAPEKYCLGCQDPLTYIGLRRLRSGDYPPPIPDLVELFLDRTDVEMYFCQGCGRVEFFMPSKSDN